jgi:hypothetical protein
MITDQLRSRIYGGTQKALWEQLWNLPESAKSVLQMVTFRLYMISRESQLSERLTPKRSIPDRRSSDATWQAGCERFAMSAAGATRTCHNVRYPVVMGGQADLEEATRNQLDLWFEKTLAPGGKATK